MIYYEIYYTDYYNYLFLPQTPSRGHILSTQKKEKAAETLLENFYACYSHNRNSNEIYIKKTNLKSLWKTKGTLNAYI